MKFTIPFLFAAFASPVLGLLPNVEICDSWDGELAEGLPLRKKLQIRIDCFLPGGNSCLNKTEVVAYHEKLNQESECECQWYQIDLQYKLFNRFQTATGNTYKKGQNMQVAYGMKKAFCVKAGDDVILTNNQEDDCLSGIDSKTVNEFAGLGENDPYVFDADSAKYVYHSMMVNTCYDAEMNFDIKAKFGLKWAEVTSEKDSCEKTVRAKFPTEIPWPDSCSEQQPEITTEKPAVTMPGKRPKSPGKGTKAPGKGTKAPGNTAPGKGTKAPGKGTKAPGNTAPGKGTKAPGSAPGKGTKAPGSAVRRRRNLA